MKLSHMSTLAFVFLITVAAYGSEGVSDIVTLQRSGVENEVMLAFVRASPDAYDLSVDDIQWLEDENVSATVIVAMLDHGKLLRHEISSISSDPQSVVIENTEVVVAPEEGQANISTFYESLAPYGTWSQDEDVGWVWEPRDGERDSNWRPYANNGHWVSTNHGWYFESSEPYAWAVFHYGRWGYNRHHRWCWAPDNVWGPSWVDWRQSDDHIGWAPLPFGSRFEAGVGFSFRNKHVGFDFHAGMEESEYSFVESSRFLDIDIGISLVPKHRHHEVYNRTTVINNTYIYNDNRIINKGVPIVTVANATNRKIVEVKVQDASIAAGQPIRGDHRNGNAIVAYRPKIANVTTELPPAVIVRREKAAERRANNTAKAEDRKVVKEDRKSAQQDASRRLAEEKAIRKNAATEKRNDNKDAATDRRMEKRDAATEKRNDNKDAANERRSDNKDAADERKAAAADKKAEKDAEKEAKQRVDAVKRNDNKDAVNERRNEAKSAAEEKRSENKAAADKRSADAESTRELQQKATEEKNNDRKSAAAGQKAARDAENEAKQKAAAEKRSEAKTAAEEKRNEKKGAAAAKKSQKDAERAAKKAEKDND